MTSFPVPDSPSSNTVVSVDATRRAILTTSLHESDCPTGRAASPSCCSWLSQIHRTRASSRWCRSPSSARAIFGTALCATGLTACGEVASIDVPLIAILLGAIPPRDHAQISQTLVVPYHGQDRPALDVTTQVRPRRNLPAGAMAGDGRLGVWLALFSNGPGGALRVFLQLRQGIPPH